MAESPLLRWDPVDGDGDPDRRIAFLHGIYGRGRNWNAVARRVVRRTSGWGAATVDLREHGDSTGFTPPHTVEAAARDLLRTAREGGLRIDALSGHSFGGKVAMEAVRLAAEDGDAPLPRQLWIVDSTPATAEPSGGPWAMLDILREHPGPFRSRDEGVHVLEEEGLATPVARWMALNLEDHGDGSWRWRIDVDVMESLLRDFFERDLWEVVESPPGELRVHVVRATGSSVLSGDSLERMREAADASGRVHLHAVEGEHWLNADNPDALVDLLVDAL